MFKPLDSKVMVAGQIRPEDVGIAASQGVTTIVNNRPDAEEPGQPDSASIAAAARLSGLDYRDIPVAGGISPAQIEAAAEAINSASGQILMFCRSGTRSTYLWALARARLGADGEELIAAAAEAGYDLSALGPHLRGGSER